MTACQGSLPELSRAKEQYEQGAKLEALQMYEDIIKRYPDHPNAQEAKQQLERMYFDAANAIVSSNPLSAYTILEQQLRLFPDGGLAMEAKKLHNRIENEALVFQKKEAQALALCQKSRKTQQVSLWREYTKNYPTGDCAREAEDSIRDLEKIFCAKAREGSPALWEQYLKDFPQGSCAQEAKEKSIRKALNPEHTQSLRIHTKECRRLAEKCPRLQERFVELVRKKETDYLRGSYYAYLKNWISAYEDASKEANTQLDSLEKEGFDVADVRKEAQKDCVDSCSENKDSLRDLKSCVLAFDTQTKERWDEYVREHPNGACVSIARQTP